MIEHPALVPMSELPAAPRRRGLRARPSRRYRHPPPQVFDAWLAVAGRQPRTRCLALDRAGMRALHVQRTRLLRFPDLVQAEVIDLGNGDCGIEVDSRSRFALYDFEVNRRRVQRWLADLEAELAAMTRAHDHAARS